MNDTIILVLLAIAAAALLAAGAWTLFRNRRTPEDRERARRRHLGSQGRLTDAYISDVSDAAIHYQYQVAGVVYDSAQDISAVRDRMPADPSLIIGPAYVKYAARDPQNSVLVTEQWSGLRTARVAQSPLKPSKKELQT